MKVTDNLCEINTMFEDLILAYYDRSKIFCECSCIFYGGNI